MFCSSAKFRNSEYSHETPGTEGWPDLIKRKSRGVKLDDPHFASDHPYNDFSTASTMQFSLLKAVVALAISFGMTKASPLEKVCCYYPIDQKNRDIKGLEIAIYLQRSVMIEFCTDNYFLGTYIVFTPPYNVCENLPSIMDNQASSVHVAPGTKCMLWT